MNFLKKLQHSLVTSPLKAGFRTFSYLDCKQDNVNNQKSMQAKVSEVSLTEGKIIRKAWKPKSSRKKISLYAKEIF